MIGFEKTHFLWRDPGHNPRRASMVMRRDLARLLGIVILSSGAFLTVLNMRSGISIAKSLVVLALIMVFMVITYYIHARVPPYVVVKDSYMYRGLTDETAEEWKFKDIARCRFVSTVHHGSPYDAIDVEMNNGDQSRILIARDIPLAALRSFLLAKGVKEE
jgi:hypothetical protein